MGARRGGGKAVGVHASAFFSLTPGQAYRHDVLPYVGSYLPLGQELQELDDLT